MPRSSLLLRTAARPSNRPVLFPESRPVAFFFLLPKRNLWLRFLRNHAILKASTGRIREKSNMGPMIADGMKAGAAASCSASRVGPAAGERVYSAGDTAAARLSYVLRQIFPGAASWENPARKWELSEHCKEFLKFPASFPKRRTGACKKFTKFQKPLGFLCGYYEKFPQIRFFGLILKRIWLTICKVSAGGPLPAELRQYCPDLCRNRQRPSPDSSPGLRHL